MSMKEQAMQNAEQAASDALQDFRVGIIPSWAEAFRSLVKTIYMQGVVEGIHLYKNEIGLVEDGGKR